MPYKAARAVAATFAYNVRHVLTPVFGNDFPSICLLPTDPNHGKFIIDPKVVRECTEEAQRWNLQSAGTSSPAMELRATSAPLTPGMKWKYSDPPWDIKAIKSPNQESGYGTDEDLHEKRPFSPDISPRSTAWTCINPSPTPTFSSVYQSVLPRITSAPHYMDDERIIKKCKLIQDGGTDSHNGSPPPVLVSGNMPTSEEIEVARILVAMSQGKRVAP